MLDVHIINYNPHPIWCKECIESVQKAIELADYPIKLHITEGGSNFAEERYKAYRLGSYPYVTYVDNDDYVLPLSSPVGKATLPLKGIPVEIKKELILNPWCALNACYLLVVPPHINSIF